MPATRSAKRQVRVSGRKQERGKAVRSECKTTITRAEESVLSGNMEEAEKAVKEAVVSLDKAARKGVLHANNAARRKARLVKKLDKAKSAQKEA